jgi:hypothetical protein
MKIVFLAKVIEIDPTGTKTVAKVLEMQCCRETFLKLSIDYSKSE